jgi:predicted PurR-regulated permease PerM
MLLLVFVLARQSLDAYQALQGFVGSGRFEEWLRTSLTPVAVQWLEPLGLLDVSRLESGLLSWLGRASTFLVSQTTEIVSGLAGFIFGLFLMLVAMYGLFVDGHHAVAFLRAIIPLPARDEDRLIQCFRDISVATIYGGVATALIQGMVGDALFVALGVPSPILWAAAMASSFIPIAGAALVWVPVGIYCLATGSALRGLLVLLLGALIISSVDNIVKPLIMRGRARMHLLLVFLGILGGLRVFGVLGLILGPLVLALLVELLQILRAELGDDWAAAEAKPPTRAVR